MSIPSLRFGRSRTWPYEDMTLYDLPKNDSIVFAFVGDSTITSFIVGYKRPVYAKSNGAVNSYSILKQKLYVCISNCVGLLFSIQ